MTKILFVDEHDQPIGAGSKKEAWEKGIRHRIARVFLFNAKGEFLLQRRSQFIDAPLEWDQSAAGHVDEGEGYEQAAYRELEEELGVKGVPLTEVVRYYLEQKNMQGKPLVPPRKRFNAIFTGVCEGPFATNEREVAEVRWIAPAELESWMARSPEEFTGGFLYAYQKFKEVNK